MSYALRNLVDGSTLPRRDKAIAREIAYYLRDDDGGIVSCSVAQLSRRSGYSDRIVRLSIAALLALGVLSVAGRHAPGVPRKYKFHPDMVPRLGYVPRQQGLFSTEEV